MHSLVLLSSSVVVERGNVLPLLSGLAVWKVGTGASQRETLLSLLHKLTVCLLHIHVGPGVLASLDWLSGGWGRKGLHVRPCCPCSLDGRLGGGAVGASPRLLPKMICCLHVNAPLFFPSQKVHMLYVSE